MFVVLLGVAAIVALAARRYGLPYTVALVVLGAAVSAAGLAVHVEITPELVLLVLVPGLVFEAAYHLDIVELRRVFLTAVVMAVPGVLMSAAAVAVVLSLIGLPLREAILIGTIVSATDPVAVIATFKSLRAPPRLATLVEAESLFNDGTAVVLFGIALQAMDHQVSLVGGATTFVATLAVSCVVGWVVGLAGTKLMAVGHDQLVALAASVVVAYGAYLVADALGQSGSSPRSWRA